MKINSIKRPWIDDKGHRFNHRKADNSFYQTKAWKTTRDAFIAANPWCIECEKEGRKTPATVADHIIRVHDGGDKLNWSNLQPLCATHHNKKDNNSGKRK